MPASYLRETAPTAAPSISIVTPTLNQGRFIRATLESVLGQGYARLEYVVADGGSDDGTLDVLAEYRDRVDRIDLGPDGGQASAINGALADATGDVLGWLNSDDLLLPGALARVGAYFAEHPEVDLVYGHRLLIDERGDEIGRWALPPHSSDALRWVDFVPQETAFWRRRLWDQLGGVSEELDVVFDWDFFRRADAAGARIVRLPRFLGAQRQHPGQKTRVHDARSDAEQERIRQGAEGERLSKAAIRAGMAPYVIRSLPYQYAHAVRARLPLRRAPVPAPAPTNGAVAARVGTREASGPARV